MREILFRGKEINKGKWIEGFLFPQNIDSGYCRLCICSSPISANDYSEILGDWSIVSEDTIGQYTGLTDKNGKKIFEGDIVKGFYKPTDKLVCGSVKYENHLARMLILNRGVCAGLSHCHHVEVIGNIHDNPELLEDKS